MKVSCLLLDKGRQLVTKNSLEHVARLGSCGLQGLPWIGRLQCLREGAPSFCVAPAIRCSTCCVGPRAEPPARWTRRQNHEGLQVPGDPGQGPGKGLGNKGKGCAFIPRHSASRVQQCKTGHNASDRPDGRSWQAHMPTTVCQSAKQVWWTNLVSAVNYPGILSKTATATPPTDRLLPSITL